MKDIGVYKIQSISKPSFCYIGSSLHLRSRIQSHISLLKNKKHQNDKLQNYFNKYGESDLVFTVLLECDKEVLMETEQFFIDAYSPYFNICKKAKSSKYHKDNNKIGIVIYPDHPTRAKLRTIQGAYEEIGVHKTLGQLVMDCIGIGIADKLANTEKL